MKGGDDPLGCCNNPRLLNLNVEPASLQAAAATAVEDSMHFNYS